MKPSVTEEVQPYVIRGYDPNAADQFADPQGFILPSKVVRASGYFYAPHEEEQMTTLSVPRQPTYGNCISCWLVGPVGDKCPDCQLTTATFKICRVRRLDSSLYPWHMVDAEHLSQLMGVDRCIHANADQRWTWGEPPFHGLTRVDVARMAHELHRPLIRLKQHDMEETLFGKRNC